MCALVIGRCLDELASFFYADERKADGSVAAGDLDGEAHGEFYSQLADAPSDVPWSATFVKGKGFVKF